MQTNSRFKVKLHVGIKDDKSGSFLLNSADFEIVVTPPAVEYSNLNALTMRCEALAREAWSKQLYERIESDNTLAHKLNDREWTIVSRTIKVTEKRKS